MRKKLSLLGVVAAIMASLALTLLTGGGTSGASTTAGNATVTVVHGIPNTPVDVYVNGTDVLPNFTFGTVSPALSVPPLSLIHISEPTRPY